VAYQTLTSPHAITDLAREISRDYGRSPPAYALERLAQATGISETDVRAMTDADLRGLFNVAQKDGVAAQRIADRIRLRVGSAHSPARPPMGASGPSIDEVRRIIRDEVQSGAIEPLQRAVEDQERSFNARMDAIGSDIRSNVAKAIRDLAPVSLVVSVANAPAVPLGLTHRLTPKVIRLLARPGRNVYLHGPAGSGKTTVAAQAGQAFNLPVYYVAKVESEYLLLGFRDATGSVVRTPFREAYEHGGVFLFDELDGSGAGAIVALNMALANGVCAFPDGVVKRHPDFKCIAAGNTTLTGSSRQYVGREQLDAASIDRFTFLEFGYDDALERALASNAEWCDYVQRIRRVIAQRELPHLVTPRATYEGCALLEDGFTWEEAAQMAIWKGLDADTVKQIEKAL